MKYVDASKSEKELEVSSAKEYFSLLSLSASCDKIRSKLVLVRLSLIKRSDRRRYRVCRSMRLHIVDNKFTSALMGRL